QGPADRPAETDRIVGQALPGGGQARSQFGQRGSRPHLHHQIIGVVVDPHEVTQIQDQIQGSQWAAPVLGGATTPGHHGQSVFGGGLQNTAEGGGVGRSCHVPGHQTTHGVLGASLPQSAVLHGRLVGDGHTHFPSWHHRSFVPQNSSAFPEATNGWTSLRTPGRSPHRRGVGRSLSGLAMPDGSKARRNRWRVSRSSGPYIRGIAHTLSTPTPCSPVMDPPCSMHRSRMAPETSSARSVAPGSESSNSTSGWRLPSPAWKTLATRIPLLTDSSAMRRRTSGSAVRGTTPSWTM